jgi:hypothetical protein
MNGLTMIKIGPRALAKGLWSCAQLPDQFCSVQFVHYFSVKIYVKAKSSGGRKAFDIP